MYVCILRNLRHGFVDVSSAVSYIKTMENGTRVDNGIKTNVTTFSRNLSDSRAMLFVYVTQIKLCIHVIFDGIS